MTLLLDLPITAPIRGLELALIVTGVTVFVHRPSAGVIYIHGDVAISMALRANVLQLLRFGEQRLWVVLYSLPLKKATSTKS